MTPMIPAPEVIRLAKSADSAPIFIYYARMRLWRGGSAAILRGLLLVALDVLIVRLLLHL